MQRSSYFLKQDLLKRTSRLYICTCVSFNLFEKRIMDFAFRKIKWLQIFCGADMWEVAAELWQWYFTLKRISRIFQPTLASSFTSVSSYLIRINASRARVSFLFRPLTVPPIALLSLLYFLTPPAAPGSDISPAINYGSSFYLREHRT